VGHSEGVEKDGRGHIRRCMLVEKDTTDVSGVACLSNRTGC
jgi:hypothetical protein